MQNKISQEIKTKIKQALLSDKFKSQREIAKHFKVSQDTVHRFKKELAEPAPTASGKFDPTNPFLRADAATYMRKNKTGFTTDQFAEKLSLTSVQAKELLTYLSHHDGFNLVFTNNKWQLVDLLPAEDPLELSKLTGTQWKFGVVSDTHLCSTAERLDVLEAAYDEFARQKIDTVFHAGNIIDGECKFNMYELKAHGLDDQALYVADHYPQRSKIKTYFITGTCHEGWYQSTNGVNVGWYLQNRCETAANRTDLIHLGHIERDVIIKQPCGSTKIRIMHPGGGAPYAISYPSQKMVESFQGGDKPNMLILGHYHKFDFNYVREVSTILAGCIQDQTAFMRKKHLAAHVGFIICTIGSRIDGTIGRTTVDWYPFYDRQYHQKLNMYELE